MLDSIAAPVLNASLASRMNGFIGSQREALLSFFIECINKIFDKYPELKEISWKQYTPNNLPFRVYDFDVNGISNWDLQEMQSWDEVFIKLKNASEEVNEVMSETPDAAFLILFGDHVFVQMTREGVTTTPLKNPD